MAAASVVVCVFKATVGRFFQWESLNQQIPSGIPSIIQFMQLFGGKMVGGTTVEIISWAYRVSSLRPQITRVNVVGVMKMGHTVPRAGLEPRYLAFRASVLPLHHIGFPDVTTISTPTCLQSSLPQRSVHTTTYVSTGEYIFFSTTPILYCSVYWGQLFVVSRPSNI